MSLIQSFTKKQNVAIFILLIFATLEFFLLLRHKNPYVSDSYFYQHIMYEYMGRSFEKAYTKTIRQLPVNTLDEIEKNFYFNEETYRFVMTFFTKRPLYPFVASVIYRLVKNEFIAFLIPTFSAFFLFILATYSLFSKYFNHFFSIIGTALLVAFYPFLDLSTYFLTDTIAACFWLGQIVCIIYYCTSRQRKWLYLYILLLIVSLTNREQNVLLLFVCALTLIGTLVMENFRQYRIPAIHLFIGSFFIVFLYQSIIVFSHQRTLLDTIIYTQNHYGLKSQQLTGREILIKHFEAIVKSHWALARDLMQHHWWFLLSLLALFGMIYKFKQMQIFDLVILSSLVSSYMAIFLYPVLSYRYFYPAVVGIIFFAMKCLHLYFFSRPRRQI